MTSRKKRKMATKWARSIKPLENQYLAPQFVGDVARLGQRCVQAVRSARVGTTPVARIGAALASTIAELFVTTVAVLQSKAPSHAMTLLRAMVEAEVDLLALKDDPTYLQQMELKSAREFIQTYEAFMTDPDVGAERGPEYEQNLDALNRARELCKTLEEMGIREAKIVERFKKAGMASEHKTVYGFLCSSAHNDLNSLAPRHIRGERIVMFVPLSNVTIKSICAVALAILLRAVKALPTFSDVELAEIEKLGEDLDREWQSLGDRLLVEQDDAVAHSIV